MSELMNEPINESTSEPQEKVPFFLALATRVRSLLGILFAVPYTMIWSVLVIGIGAIGYDRLATKLIRLWSRILLAIFGIRVHCRGEENLPAQGGGIVVFNHQSLFDIPVLMSTTNKNIRFGAKIELFKIPFFGAAMRAVGTLPIARDNRTEVLRLYKESQSRFQRDILFVLAPEGTRQTDPVIGRFKKGPFIFALNGGVPVIPAVIKGAHRVLPKKSLSVNFGKWIRDIQVEYLAPVVPPPLAVPGAADGRESESLMSQVRATMVESYARL
jgi:1-acyl-sn-glycerol-3-phosphate acyltransferase